MGPRATGAALKLKRIAHQKSADSVTIFKTKSSHILSFGITLSDISEPKRTYIILNQDDFALF